MVGVHRITAHNHKHDEAMIRGSEIRKQWWQSVTLHTMAGRLAKLEEIGRAKRYSCMLRRKPTGGSFGIVVEHHDELCNIVRVVTHTKTDVQPNDVIIEVDGITLITEAVEDFLPQFDQCPCTVLRVDNHTQKSRHETKGHVRLNLLALLMDTESSGSKDEFEAAEQKLKDVEERARREHEKHHKLGTLAQKAGHEIVQLEHMVLSGVKGFFHHERRTAQIMSEMEATIHVQKMWRKHLARQELRRRQILLHFATRVQATWRGLEVRRELARLRQGKLERDKARRAAAEDRGKLRLFAEHEAELKRLQEKREKAERARLAQQTREEAERAHREQRLQAQLARAEREEAEKAVARAEAAAMRARAEREAAERAAAEKQAAAERARLETAQAAETARREMLAAQQAAEEEAAAMANLGARGYESYGYYGDYGSDDAADYAAAARERAAKEQAAAERLRAEAEAEERAAELQAQRAAESAAAARADAEREMAEESAMQEAAAAKSAADALAAELEAETMAAEAKMKKAKAAAEEAAALAAAEEAADVEVAVRSAEERRLREEEKRRREEERARKIAERETRQRDEEVRRESERHQREEEAHIEVEVSAHRRDEERLRRELEEAMQREVEEERQRLAREEENRRAEEELERRAEEEQAARVRDAMAKIQRKQAEEQVKAVHKAAHQAKKLAEAEAKLEAARVEAARVEAEEKLKAMQRELQEAKMKAEAEEQAQALLAEKLRERAQQEVERRLEAARAAERAEAAAKANAAKAAAERAARAKAESERKKTIDSYKRFLRHHDKAAQAKAEATELVFAHAARRQPFRAKPHAALPDATPVAAIDRYRQMKRIADEKAAHAHAQAKLVAESRDLARQFDQYEVYDDEPPRPAPAAPPPDDRQLMAMKRELLALKVELEMMHEQVHDRKLETGSSLDILSELFNDATADLQMLAGIAPPEDPGVTPTRMQLAQAVAVASPVAAPFETLQLLAEAEAAAFPHAAAAALFEHDINRTSTPGGRESEWDHVRDAPRESVELTATGRRRSGVRRTEQPARGGGVR